MFVLGEKRVFLVADRIGLERNRNEERLDAAPGNTAPLRRFVRAHRRRLSPTACRDPGKSPHADPRLGARRRGFSPSCARLLFRDRGAVVSECDTSGSAIRFEDERLLTGRGDFLEDGNAHRQGYMSRSPRARVEIRSIDSFVAQAFSGAVAAVTGRDYIDAGRRSIPYIGPPTQRRGGSAVPDFWPVDPVRMVGEDVAFVVVETAVQALDVSKTIEVGYAPLPACTDMTAALSNGALWPGDNEAPVHETGDREAADKAFFKAERAVERRSRLNRVLGHAMETRGCAAIYDRRSDRYALRAPMQHPWVARKVISGRAIGEARVRVAAAMRWGWKFRGERLSRVSGGAVRRQGDRASGQMDGRRGRSFPWRFPCPRQHCPRRSRA